MKKTIIGLLCGAFFTFTHASIPQKIDSESKINNTQTKIQKTEVEDQYLKDVYTRVPDMQDVGIQSNIRSQKEGAALQFIATNGISRTGFSKDDFARLLNNESSMVKEYVKVKKLKGYLLIENILLFSKGYPELPEKDLQEFKKNSECQNGYCVYVGISSIKLLNEKRQEIFFDKEKFMKIAQKYENPNKLWEVKHNEIPEDYKQMAVKVITGFGLGGLDALDLMKRNK